MGKKPVSKRNRDVIKDELDAEVRYQLAMKDARQAAKMLADDAERDDVARAAAEKTAEALRVVDDARRRALIEPEPIAAKRSFAQAVKDWAAGL